MSADAWTLTIEAELDDLLGRAGALAPDDYWRALVLMGRAAQHPALPESVEALVGRCSETGLTQRALSTAARPTAADVLDELDDALLAGDDPAGPLADALLEVDDLLSVLEFEGEAEVAGQVVAQAVALLDLEPLQVAGLDQWARQRLATLGEGAVPRELWSAVATAAANATLAVLPARASATRDVAVLLDRAEAKGAEVIELWPSTPTVRRAWRAAAADYGSGWEPAEGDNWTTYDDDGVTFAQVRVGAGEAPPQAATLIVEAEQGRWETPLPAHRVGGSSVWFRLGSEQELAAIFVRAREALGVGTDAVPALRLEWERDGRR